MGPIATATLTSAPPSAGPTSGDVATEVFHARTDEGEPIYRIGAAALPEGGNLLLLRCGDDFSIQLDDEELMGSTDHVSEEALATIVAARMPRPEGPVLIGGLGMGFTLGAALAAWPAPTPIEVAELLPEVLAWARGPLAHLFGGNLSDPRTTVTLADIHDVIERAESRYAAILLDVDNGPDGFIRDANDRLYCAWGLRSAYRALLPGGMLAVWSAYRDHGFMARLAEAGFAVEEIILPAFVGSETETHCIWLACKPVTPA